MASGLMQNSNRMREGNFIKFDIVEDYSDHHYAVNKSQRYKNCFTNTRSQVHKRIMREWKILEENLPDTIFVRVYEKRIDLLRAVIIGAQGTPYHDGLFFFDLAFPSNYPTKPPHVFFRSHGLRLNPHLYEDGLVCLSLLNTWGGEETEKWTTKSTILQVLVSIQGLVLNAKPYFNESGAIPRITSSWETYNEKVFEMSCNTMLLQLQNPPKNFKSFVADHFRDRACNILRASKAYRDGLVRIGLFSEDASSPSSQDNKTTVSTKFRDSMDRLSPQLSEAFSRNVASLQNIFENEEIESKVGENTVKKKKKFVMLHKIFGKLELCLGFNDTNKSK